MSEITALAKEDNENREENLVETPARHRDEKLYRVWACDNQVYGPVQFSTLMDWAEDGRVFRDTWVYQEDVHEWHRAGKIPGLERRFPEMADTVILVKQLEETTGVSLAELRQFEILANLRGKDLVRLPAFAQVAIAQPHEVIIKRDEPGDSFYLVLSGSVRARIFVGGDERSLARIPAGQFFGDLSMFTQTPRSADVLAEQESRLLRFSARAFQRLVSEDPAAAAPLLLGLASNLARHIVDDNKRFQLEVASEFVWR